jgi:hypothetical protein
MEHLLAIAGANFVFIGLKAFQQLNVVHGERTWVFLTSNLMAFSEVFLVASYARNGAALPVIVAVGVSGGLGCIFSMWLRTRLFKPTQA